MKHLEDSKNEWKNYEASKSVEIFDKDRIHLIHGDSSDLSKYLDDEQVDCIPNSPPYFGAVRTYLQDGQKVKSSKKKIDQIGHENDVDIYLEELMKVYRECKRVLKNTGSIFVNIADSRVDGVMMNINGKLIELMKKEGLSYIQTIIHLCFYFSLV